MPKNDQIKSTTHQTHLVQNGIQTASIEFKCKERSLQLENMLAQCHRHTALMWEHEHDTKKKENDKQMRQIMCGELDINKFSQTSS